MSSLKKVSPLGLLVVVLLTAACGSSPQSLNPIAPSAFPLANVALDVNGDVGASTADIATAMSKPADRGKPDDKDKPDDKGGKPDDKGKPEPTPVPPAMPVTAVVQIEGLIAEISGTSITVNDRAVVVPADAVIRHGSRAVAFSELRIGDRVHIKARLLGTVLEASEVKLQNSGDGEDEDGGNAHSEGSVWVSPLDATASETGTDTGVFRLTRSASATLPLTSPLTVTFTLTGTATNGTDYANVPVTVTFLAGQATVDVTVTPTPDDLAEVSETVVLTLTSVTPYALGAPSTATVTITDAASVPVVSVSAFDASASEIGPDTGTFRFTRTGSTTLFLTVTYTVTGTAVNGTDYDALPLTVTFLAGQATADRVVVPLADGSTEGAETVILTLTDGAAYDLGASATATITIAG